MVRANYSEMRRRKAFQTRLDRSALSQQETPRPEYLAPMDISIVIVSWNAKAYLKVCLESIAIAPPCRSTEVIVVDNASTDGSADMVEATFPHVKLIRSDENLGFAKANNMAIQQCRGRCISLVNSDVKILPGCLDALASYLDHNPRVGNVGPRILNADMSLQSSCRRFPSLWNNLCSALGLAAAFKNSRLFSGEHMLFFPHDRALSVDVLVGCFWMIRRETLQAVGPLDEEFFMYSEDVDWCRRCWAAGWQVAFFPGGQAIHYRGRSSAKDPVRFEIAQQRSLLQYWHKHHGLLGLLEIRGVLVCHHALRCLYGLLSRCFRSSGTSRDAGGLVVSISCLRALFSSGFPNKG